MVAQVQDIETIDRFMQWVSKTPACWLWNGYLKPNGYASFYPGGGKHVPKVYAHRWAYEYFCGPIASGLEVDHLCNVRHCVNPEHLEVVTRRVNLDRRNANKTHCVHGHELTPENAYWRSTGRICRTCHIERERAARAKRRATQ